MDTDDPRRDPAPPPDGKTAPVPPLAPSSGSAAFLNVRGPVAPGSTPDPPEHPEKIGPYRILGVLGEGGMGIVYAAEQSGPIRRRVALKVIKLGMDTREVVARFEAERQALALMDHPNIARVLDGGATPDGRPYFVMEQVQGVPLTQYCDRHRLPLGKRLGLFLQICRAVEHAHHRGIIHRDLKPSNILVSCPDEEPVAKIIDFGVAKAINQRLTEKTIYTGLGRAVGTPAYMSPEQAEMTAEEVDGRTDVYSLGVILYELLVGELPLDWEDLSKAAYDEIVRRIREEEPPTPSTRWQRLNPDTTTKLAERRSAGAAGAIARELRGDLDWIAMKAIEKERNRRYGSASELAADIDRHLRNEAVLAGPPSAIYRIQKFARKNRGPVLAAGAVFAALLLGLAASLVLYGRSEANRRLALEKEREAKALLEEVIGHSDLNEVKSCRLEADKLWPAFSSNVEALEAWLRKVRALTDRFPQYRLTLENFRKKALPYGEEEAKRDRETHPRARELEGLLERRKKALEELAKLESEAPRDTATVLSYGGDENKKLPAYYFRTSFEVEDPGKFSALRFLLLAGDGAVAYLNGKEVFRENLPEGPVEHAALALRPMDEKEIYKEHEASLSGLEGAIVSGKNVLAVEVHLASRRDSDLRFDLELTAKGDVGSAATLVPRGSLWRYSDRGEYPGDAWRGPGYDDSAWKTGTGPLGHGFRTGRGRIVELRQEERTLAGKIQELQKVVEARRTWRFDESRKQSLHDALQELVQGLEALLTPDPFKGTITGVEKRLEFARTVKKRTIEDEKSRWDEAIASIRNREECPKYRGLSIAPQEGLIPIGRDAQSGLWEFAHLQTGDVPARGPDGKIIVTEEMGLVFVLIPGGTFRMGAVKPDEKNPEGSPNVDPYADPDENPVHEVTLSPFFLSKYEMTQGQWLRFTGENPSRYGPGSAFGGQEIDLRHPVETVSWEDCRETMDRLGLLLPTEAQWEYAARAGTCTAWWTGDRKETIQGAANLADVFSKKNGGPASWTYEEWLDDGYSTHSPVGSFKPNGFGLHDVVGNVWEWCRDGSRYYDSSWKAGDGEREVWSTQYRVFRGGCFDNHAANARSARRHLNFPGFNGFGIGFRPARVITE